MDEAKTSYIPMETLQAQVPTPKFIKKGPFLGNPDCRMCVTNRE